jgi:hypothetical protein
MQTAPATVSFAIIAAQNFKPATEKKMKIQAVVLVLPLT